MTEAIDKMLEERGKNYGDYGVMSRAIQQLKQVFRGYPSWADAPSTVRETLDSIALKLGRILAGNPLYPDHWRDIAGYATKMVEQREGANDLSSEPASSPRFNRSGPFGELDMEDRLRMGTATPGDLKAAVEYIGRLEQANREADQTYQHLLTSRDTAERAAIVGWLRAQSVSRYAGEPWITFCASMAQKIERGDHHKGAKSHGRD